MLLLAFFLKSAQARQAIVAYTANVNGPYGAAGANGGLNIGYSFSFSGTNLEIFSLGVYNFGGAGLNAPHTVALFSNNGGAYTPVSGGSVTVPAGTNTVLLNAYRFQPLPTPVVLSPGNYVVIAFQMNGGANNDPYSDDNGQDNFCNGFPGFNNLGGIYQFTSQNAPNFPASGSGYNMAGVNYGSASFIYATIGSSLLIPADAPKISPTNVVTYTGQSVTLTATDDGTSPNYQWYYGNTQTPIAGATNATLILANLQTNQTAGNAGVYYVSAQNYLAAPVFTQNPVTVTVNPGIPVNTPTISPSNTVVNAGQNLTLTANDLGTPPLVYQWYYGNGLATIAGATNASLLLTNLQNSQTAGNAGNYYVSALNSFSGPILSVNPAQVTVVSVTPQPPGTPSVSPAGVSVVAGQNVTLTASDSGTAPISYQWYYGAGRTPIAGATNATMTLDDLQTNQVSGGSGEYFVSAQNAYGGPIYTTNPVNVTVIPAAGPLKIMPTGDSITDGFRGYGGYRAPLYQFLANANIPFTFVGSQNDNSVPWLPYPDHEGISGSEINSVASGFPIWGPAYTPDIVLLLIGTNDYDNDQNGTDSYAAGATNRLDSLVQEMATNQPNADLFVANLTLRTDSASIEGYIETNFNPFVPIIVSNHFAMGQHVYFVDMHSSLGPSDLSDGLHPNQTGYNKMAAVWFNAITSVIHRPALPAPVLTFTSTNVTTTYQAVPGFEYVMQRSTNPISGPWFPLSTNVVPTNGVLQVTDGFGDLGSNAPPAAFYQPTLILY